MIQISQSELKKELNRIRQGVLSSEIEGSTEFLDAWRAGCISAVDVIEQWIMVHLMEQAVEQPPPPPERPPERPWPEVVDIRDGPPKEDGEDE